MHVLLIDDHPLYRQALGSHLHVLADRVVVVEASSCAQALASVTGEQQVELVLLDIYLAGENGLDQLRKLRVRFPAAPIVMISASEEAARVRDAIALGAEGYIPKSATAEVVRGALQVVMNGGTYVPAFALAPPANAMELSASAEAQARRSGELLTARQQEILACLAEGHSNKQIAGELGVAESTIRAQVTRIFKCLNVSNRTAASYAAILRGLIKHPMRERSKP